MVSSVNSTIMWLLLCLIPLCSYVEGQINRQPVFVTGGDLKGFKIKEDTVVGTPVYTLRGRDPENTRVTYYISGDSFSVNKDTGVVTLIKPLDREREATIDVIASVSDQAFQGKESNTVSVKREITIVDVNDNPPVFQNVPYAFSLPENTTAGSVIYTGILVSDADEGLNSDIKLMCLREASPEACDKFNVHLVKLFRGRYRGEIILKEKLDYEEKTSYTMVLYAEDMADYKRLNQTARVVITVKDVQDQPPVFTNAPFSATVQENSATGTQILKVFAKDGDTGEYRPLEITTENDHKGYISLSSTTYNGKGVYSAILETSDVPFDREDPEILNNGGLYLFQIKATELVDGKPTGSSTLANVTIVVGDVNDQPPIFNQDEFNLTVSEDIGNNTPLPGLEISVSDGDVGDNAKFALSIENVHNSEGVFSIFPSMAVGRTPVVVKVIDASMLDYEDPSKRFFQFRIKAEQENMTTTYADVTINLFDANDNAPIFNRRQYQVEVPENTPSGTPVFTLRATDADSGSYGRITYSLKGSDKFTVDPESGVITVAECSDKSCLDYEVQQGYSLTYDAQDGDGKISSVNIFVQILDLNDNYPVFQNEEYIREIQEKLYNFTPPLFIKATDIDGPTQGGGEVTYTIQNSGEIYEPTPIRIHPRTGEVTLTNYLKYDETPGKSGQITLIIEGTDSGNPPLTSETKLIIKVRKENYGAPEFFGEPYKATVKEDASPGTKVFKVSATDPDGPDSAIRFYTASGSRDNFVVDEQSGLVQVSTTAQLDRDLFGDSFKVVVYAVDMGAPVQQTATATVTVMVEDVNNKPPIFTQESYVQYISEGLKPGDPVITINAKDPDENAKLKYSIVEPITARDKTGTVVAPNTQQTYKTGFAINGTSGQVIVNKPLDYNAAAVISLTIMAEDLNAIPSTKGSKQEATADLTIYIQSLTETKPIFPSPWSLSNPKIEVTVPEEGTLGSVLLSLSAYDPVKHEPVTNFQITPGSDIGGYVKINPRSGSVTLNRRLDYEVMNDKSITFQIIARAEDRSSVANVMINVTDINDNSPVFSKDAYETSVSETVKYPAVLITVNATDLDSEKKYGSIRYSLSGDGSDVFIIDERKGSIQVKNGSSLDREKQAVYNLLVTASDSPDDSDSQRKTSVLVMIRLLDENDNAPLFNKPMYTAVVPENVPTGFSVLTVGATDPDDGRNGEIHYSVVYDDNEGPARFFTIDSNTGMLSVVRPLTGKGRKEPYMISVRATDNGSPPLHTDVAAMIIVGDVSSNDGVPQFVKPVAGESAHIHENATIGSVVFNVIAFDPDTVDTTKGRVGYRFLDDEYSTNGDFIIDAVSGVITTSAKLDRERKENYTMIVVAQDFGVPPQEAHQVLYIHVLDVDDNEPKFKRPENSVPIDIVVKEETAINTVIGKVQAYDPDKGDNAIIDYHIVDGNANDVFDVRRTFTNEGELFIKNRLDREQNGDYLLTIKVNKPSKTNRENTKIYDPSDLSEIQVKIKVEDIDDNPPVFEQNMYDIGVRLTAEVGTEIITVKAVDPDSSSGDVTYSIKSTSYSQFASKESKDIMGFFEINPKAGVIKVSQSLGKFAGGFFNIKVEAQSSASKLNIAVANIKVYVLHDRDLMKFVFGKQPNEVQESLPKFQRELRAALPQPAMVNIYDTQYYSRKDGSLDFESTGSCFQVIQNDAVLPTDKVLKVLDSKSSPKLDVLFKNYSVVKIESCASGKSPYSISWAELFIIILAAMIAVVATAVTFLVCWLFSRFKRKTARLQKYNTMGAPMPSTASVIMSHSPHQRIFDWQETNTIPPDAQSYRSFPTLR